jgi:GMP reductase
MFCCFRKCKPIPVDEIYLDFDDVMIVPKFTTLSSPSEVILEKEFIFTNKYSDYQIVWRGIPIIAANIDSIGTFKVYDVLRKYKILTAMNKFYTLKDYNYAMSRGITLEPDYFMVSTGISNENYDNLVEILENISCNWICIDIANGYMESFLDFCKKVRTKFPDKIIVAGNVATPEMVKRLLHDADVNIVKVGIGPCSSCFTRINSGVGVPQFTALNKCREKYIMSDGDVKNPSDLAKAFGTGTDFVMISDAFAGHYENPGEVIEENGEKYKIFYGMSSNNSTEKYFRNFEQSILKIKYKGKLEDTVNDFLSGLKSACIYTNSSTLNNFPMNVKFIRRR